MRTHTAQRLNEFGVSESQVQLYGVCLDSRPLRIVTEYCGGGAVFELLHNSPIDLAGATVESPSLESPSLESPTIRWTSKVYPQQIKMCRDVARAMNYLHTFNPMIIHRDLKSLNLLLDKPVTGVAVLSLEVETKKATTKTTAQSNNKQNKQNESSAPSSERARAPQVSTCRW